MAIKKIIALGFRKNTRYFKGFIPHFVKGKDVLFLIGGSYWPNRIYNINILFENYPGKVFGVLTEKAPPLAAKDWVTAPNLTLLKLDPLSIGQWNDKGDDIEFIQTSTQQL
ncbi:MAG: hypothetical protein PHD06_11220 [Bacteroidales bacterium]|nr:hypothetical protein [Bacteroidales bacterium]